MGRAGGLMFKIINIKSPLSAEWQYKKSKIEKAI
jgi:hypothetical protein